MIRYVENPKEFNSLNKNKDNFEFVSKDVAKEFLKNKIGVF